MRALILKGPSMYGGTRLFCDNAAAALAQRGWQVALLDLENRDVAATILQVAATAGSFDLIFSINILGDFKDGLGRSLRDLFGGPHVVWFVDYVLSQGPRIRGTPASTAILVVDPTQLEAIRQVYGAGRFAYLGFLPHPAIGQAAADDASVAAFCERRPIEILWSGSYTPPDLPWDQLQEASRRILRDAVDEALSVEWAPPHEVLDRVLAARGLDLSSPTAAETREAARLVDSEVRKVRRMEFLVAVAKTGLPLRICGAWWENQLSRFSNAVYEGAVDMTRVAELMAQSRLVLNTNGNFGAGSHERPFSASLAGAATFSDVSRYYAQVFRPGENIELFQWKQLDAGMDALVSLAGDPERCFAYGRSAKALALQAHTWDTQIDAVLAAADAVR